MSEERHRRFVVACQCVAGLCDTATGIALLLAPAWTMARMGVQRQPPPVFASYLGVFVLAVGLFYFYGLADPLDSAHAPQRRTVWTLTALTRTLVSVFVLSEVLAGRLDPPWLTVAATDALFALVQWWGLTKGWLTVAA